MRKVNSYHFCRRQKLIFRFKFVIIKNNFFFSHRSLEQSMFSKANELQEDISIKRFEYRTAQMHLAAVKSQVRFFRLTADARPLLSAAPDGKSVNQSICRRTESQSRHYQSFISHMMFSCTSRQQLTITVIDSDVIVAGYARVCHWKCDDDSYKRHVVTSRSTRRRETQCYVVVVVIVYLIELYARVVSVSAVFLPLPQSLAVPCNPCAPYIRQVKFA